MRSRLLRYVSLLDKAHTGLTRALTPDTAYVLFAFCLIVFGLICGELIYGSASVSFRSLSNAHSIRATSAASPAARETTQPHHGPSGANINGDIYKDLHQAAVETQLQVKFSKLPRVKEIPPGSNIFLTFSNGHYAKLMLNAASLVADLGYPVVVLVFDQEAAKTCEIHNLPYIWSSTHMDTADFRQDRLRSM